MIPDPKGVMTSTRSNQGPGRLNEVPEPSRRGLPRPGLSNASLDSICIRRHTDRFVTSTLLYKTTHAGVLVTWGVVSYRGAGRYH